MTNPHHEYRNRIDRVIDHLRRHLDRAPNLRELARVACFSEFHFHRIFTAITGQTVNEFATRLRLEKAARLLTNSRDSTTEIALECGFSSSSAFSRAFRNAFGTTPRAFRKTGWIENSKIRQELFEREQYHLEMSDAEKAAAFPVEIIDFPEWTAAYIRVANAFDGERVRGAFARMIEWTKSAGIFDSGTLFGMSIDDPTVTPKHLYTYEVCFASPAKFDCPDGISRIEMPARKYAVSTVAGDIRMVATAWDYLFRKWLVESDFEPDHAPALEIFTNKDNALDWREFQLKLAVPIRSFSGFRR